MITVVIDLEGNNYPNWMLNFLNYSGCHLISMFRVVTPTQRKLLLSQFVSGTAHNIVVNNDIDFGEISKHLSFDDVGNAIFSWETEAEQTLFFLKWG